MLNPNIAVLIPCYNEAATVVQVITDFKAALPQATVYVYDNNSIDDTARLAATAGAVVRSEPQQGKGAVVRRMFRDIEADFYLMVDGDHTYDAALAPRMLELAITQRCDLVNCIRKETEQSAYRAGHRLGNTMLTGAVRKIFGNRIHDMLSGYKIFSRRFVKSFPISSMGFGIETELAIHALELKMPVAHLEGAYRGRIAGSTSKLNTWHDGFRILWLIAQLFKHERPTLFFSIVGLFFVLLSLILGVPLIIGYLHTGLVPRLPTGVVATGLMLLGCLSFTTGLILSTVTRGRREAKMLAYLAIPFHH
jgi:glycosyltransferase involved in cell wall biosynthesis